jgi:hypothetical protein
MNLNELEELVYDLAALSHKLGRIETDGTTSQNKYDKLVDERNDIKALIRTEFNRMSHNTTLGWGKGKDE